MKKICWEESVHIMHGRDVVLTLMNGTDAQRAMVQEALDRWWGPLMQMHGPPTDPAKDKDLHWKIKSKNNEQLRQEFLSIYVPRIRELGLTIPDPDLRLDDATGRWHYTEPDWDELKSVVTGHGPGLAIAARLPACQLRRDPVGPRRPPGERNRRSLTSASSPDAPDVTVARPVRPMAPHPYPGYASCDERARVGGLPPGGRG